CKSATCRHSTPPSPDDIFTGYNSTGRPRWEELLSFLLGINDKRADLLFAKPPKLLARFVGRRHLVGDQLSSFGQNSFTYRIWGQVIAGYLHLNGGRGALTVQLVETLDHKLHLQVITPDHFRQALADATPDKASPLYRVHDAVRMARTEILSLSHIWQTAERKTVKKQIRNRAFAALRHLGHSIERKGRQQGRRTPHAELRNQQKRPVHKAREDLANAPCDHFFTDTLKNSLIVVGKSGRLHVFGTNHRHITSLTISREDLEKRQRRKRYQRMNEEDAQTFRKEALRELHTPDE
ncbi:MAG: hypothetical protein K9N51_07720, partial [Candidatus Pacebacteria bacterium]|nr:hypothetical protein [Candidatus Paceibacterota bacterium]